MKHVVSMSVLDSEPRASRQELEDKLHDQEDESSDSQRVWLCPALLPDETSRRRCEVVEGINLHYQDRQVKAEEDASLEFRSLCHL